MKARHVIDALIARHQDSGPGAWVCVEEALAGFAHDTGGIDLLALGVWASAQVAGTRASYRVTYPPLTQHEYLGLLRHLERDATRRARRRPRRPKPTITDTREAVSA